MISTILIQPLLLVTLLAVSWVEAVPLPAAPENEDLSEELGAFMEQNPSIARDLYPDLVNAASGVSLTVDQDVVLELLENYVRDATVQEVEEELEREEEAEFEEEHSRKKRQTSVKGGINASGRSIGASGSVTRTFGNGRHSFSGQLEARRDRNPGAGSFNSFSAGAGYSFTPDARTSLNIDAHKSISPAGNSHGIGITFKHKFRR